MDNDRALTQTELGQAQSTPTDATKTESTKSETTKTEMTGRDQTNRDASNREPDDAKAERHPLEVLADEFAERLRGGESPSIAEYERRFPELASRIRPLFHSIVLFERVSNQEHDRIQTVRSSLRHPLRERESIGDFRIVREIGRGGMGIVYEAVQQSLKRRIALKVLGPGFAPTPKQLDRFRRESEAVARLHHTNIVPIFGVGEEDGIHYFAMQLIDGVPLSEVRARRVGSHEDAHHPLSDFLGDFRRVASIGAQIADALSYAHQHGVLHRDVKPSNLVLDRQGEVWVTDFGLAKMTEFHDLTQSGDLVGTLSYMAPEQLEGKSDERADIYGLGLTLHELITGKPAFPPTESLMERLRRRDVPRPRSLRPELPRDLETIILKATAYDPASRYVTAGEMAEDLRRFVDDRPILGRRASAAERLGRWCRRNPAVAISSGIAVMLLGTVAVVATVGNWRTSRALVEAREARRAAERSETRAWQAQERAETNLNVAIEAFEGIFDHVASRGVPRSLELEFENEETPHYQTVLTDADAELLRSLLTFYEQLTRQNIDDVELRAKTATAYRRIGQIRQRLGQESEADESLSTAVTMFRQLNDEYPSRVDFLVATARTRNDQAILWGEFQRPGSRPQLPSEPGRGDIARKDRGWRDLVRQHREAAALLVEQRAATGDDATVRFELARSYDLASSVLTRIGMARVVLDGFHVPRLPDGPPPGPPGRPPPGRPPGRGSRMERPEGMPGGPTAVRGAEDPRVRPPEFMGPRPGAGLPRGPVARQPGVGPPGPPPGLALPDWVEIQEMEKDAERACQLLEQLLAADPQRAEYRVALARAEHHRFLHYLVTHQGDLAIPSFERARELRETLVADFPARPELLLELADLLSSGGIYLSSMQEEEAERMLERSIEACRQLKQDFPSVAEYPALLATTFRNRGRMSRVRGHWDDADRDFVGAIEELDYLITRFPDREFYRHALLMGVVEAADLKRTRGALEGAERWLIESRKLLEETLERFEQDHAEQNRLVAHGGLMAVKMQLAMTLRALGDDEAADAATRNLFPPRPMR